MSWTTPEDIRGQVERHWRRGHLLVPPGAEPLFPMALRLSRPTPRELSERFDDVRGWIRTLEQASKPRAGTGYEIHWAEVNHRQLGTNRVPTGVVVPTLEDALSLIGKRRASERFRSLLGATEERCPRLVSWVKRRPLAALDQADDWEKMLATVGWFERHPRSGIYLRQMDVAGVDTKFVEGHRLLIAELLDEVLPAASVSPEFSPTRQFEQRYGLRVKVPLVRFRILDERLSVQGLTDLATPATQFAQLSLAVKRIFLTENEVNGLTFPSMSSSIVIFGLGYGLDRLSEIGWLRDSAIHYWGDIDTHGFSILDRLRGQFPHVRSFLMDRETLMAHRPLWGEEPIQHEGRLERLTVEEQRLYRDLREGELGRNIRLEQERVAFSSLESTLAGIRE